MARTESLGTHRAPGKSRSDRAEPPAHDGCHEIALQAALHPIEGFAEGGAQVEDDEPRGSNRSSCLVGGRGGGAPISPKQGLVRGLRAYLGSLPLPPPHPP